MISVIVATYNRNQILCNTIDYILQQKNVDYELIVVDQSESHDQYTIDFLTKNKHLIKLITPTIANLPRARNTGIKASQGEIVVFFDDDVIIGDSLLYDIEVLFKAHSDMTGLTGVHGGVELGWTDAVAQLPRRFRKRVEPDNRLWVSPIDYLPGYFMAFRKPVLYEIGGFDEWIGFQPSSANEDGELCLRLKSREYNLAMSPFLKISHLAETLGGCEVRNDYDVNVDKIRYNQFRMVIYGILVNRNSFSASKRLQLIAKSIYLYFYNNRVNISKMPVLFLNSLRALNEFKNTKTQQRYL